MALKYKDYLLGAGKLYFDRFNDDGDKVGERYLGNSPGFSITLESEDIEHESSDEAVSEVDRRIQLKVKRSGSLQVDNVSIENLALFIQGDIATVTQAAVAVVNEAISDVIQGYWYQLGNPATFPTGVRNVTSVVVTNVAGSTTYILNTDYVLDAEMGRIQIVEGGGIADGGDLHVDYTPAAETRDQIASSPTPIKGALRYIADNRDGDNKDAYAPNCVLSPNGEMQMKGKEFAVMGFTVSFNLPSEGTLQALYIDGRAA